MNRILASIASVTHYRLSTYRRNAFETAYQNRAEAVQSLRRGQKFDKVCLC